MPKHAFTIRRALSSDLDDVYSLQEVSGYTIWPKSQVSQLIDSETVLVCLNEKKATVTGFLFYRLVLDEAELLSVAVSPDYRHQGVAMALLNVFIEQVTSTGASQIFLEVAENNTAALALYKKNSFEKIAVRKDYYKQADGQYDACILRLSLS